MSKAEMSESGFCRFPGLTDSHGYCMLKTCTCDCGHEHWSEEDET